MQVKINYKKTGRNSVELFRWQNHLLQYNRFESQFRIPRNAS